MSDSDQQDAQSASTPTFVTALVFNAIVFGAEIGVFTLLRPYFKAIYEPRTYVPPKSRRIAPLTPSFKGALDLKTYLSWPWAVFMSDPEEIKHANGLDAYFFVRFLRMMVKIFLPIWIISWAVLLPTTSVGTGVSGHSGLDRFIFGNVANDQTERYAAHIILVYIFTGALPSTPLTPPANVTLWQVGYSTTFTGKWAQLLLRVSSISSTPTFRKPCKRIPSLSLVFLPDISVTLLFVQFSTHFLAV